MPQYNVSEPDITLTSEPDGTRLIPLHSVRPIIEVADTTLRSDITCKSAIYAQHSIPEYWVVDVNGG
ncbi:Uma2 family endonuclease [uncultured Sphingomonas sp.]|uniref:Uma2 family endonuclease n=1 Tax=uncultured Sphingomonas sp. TaxID=158754 RepID=UPI00345A1893